MERECDGQSYPQILKSVLKISEISTEAVVEYLILIPLLSIELQVLRKVQVDKSLRPRQSVLKRYRLNVARIKNSKCAS